MRGSRLLPPIGIVLLLLGVVGWPAAATAAPTELTTCGTIALPGSYVVANNLASASDCLVIDADFVTVDLQGFVLRGTEPRGCRLECNATGDGIRTLPGTLHRGIAILNGAVVNFRNGIELTGEGFHVERVRAIGNGRVGISLASGALTGVDAGGGIVKDCIALDNGLGGIAAKNSVIAGNVVRRTRGALDGTPIGIFAEYSTVVGNTANEGHEGILGYLSTLANNTANANHDAGIEVDCPSGVVGNTATDNATNLRLTNISGRCTTAHNAAP